MSIFSFGSKTDASRDPDLTDLAFFSTLNVSDQKTIVKKGRLQEFRRGDIVYQEGSQAEDFYVVLSGKFRLVRKNRAAGPAEEVLGNYYRGDHFGEASLLTSQNHSAVAEAARDGVLLRFSKDDFFKIIRDYPSLSLHLNRSLGYRLTRTVDRAGSREVKIAAFIPVVPDDSLSELWLDLGNRLFQEVKTPVMLVDFDQVKHPGEGRLPAADLPVIKLTQNIESLDAQVVSKSIRHVAGFDYLKIETQESSASLAGKIDQLMGVLSQRHSFLLFRLPAGFKHPAYQILTKTDEIYLYDNTLASALGPFREALARLQKQYGFGKTEVKLLLGETSGLRSMTAADDASMDALIQHRIPSKKSKADRYWGSLRYLARDLSGRLVGLALGSGAAYGLSHIGVLKVLEEFDLRPDIIAGSSIGALIGGFWAAGMPARDIEQVARSLDKKTAFFRLVGFRDLEILTKGFLKGDQVKRFLHHYLGDQTFDDLQTPIKIVGVDLFTSEAVVLDQGSVVDAIRASISIPGIFTPVNLGGRTLIDGGVIDPLPIRALNRYGVHKILAVNVLAGSQDRTELNRKRELNLDTILDRAKPQHPLEKMFRRILRPVAKTHAVNIFNVIMNTIQFMEFEIADAWSREADILIHPIVLDAHWAEFYSADKFIKAGESKTRDCIEEISRLVRED